MCHMSSASAVVAPVFGTIYLSFRLAHFDSNKTDTICRYVSASTAWRYDVKQIVIRNLDDSVIHMLKKIAWMDGKSPEDTARRLLIEAVYSRMASVRAAMRATEPARQQTP